MDQIMNKENEWNDVTEANMVQGPIERYLERNRNSKQCNHGRQLGHLNNVQR